MYCHVKPLSFSLFLLHTSSSFLVHSSEFKIAMSETTVHLRMTGPINNCQNTYTIFIILFSWKTRKRQTVKIMSRSKSKCDKYFAVNNLHNKHKEVVKEFWQKASSQGADFSRGQCKMTPTSREHCSRLQQSRCYAVIEDWMIPFAAYTAAANSQSFSLGRTTPKIAPSRGGNSTPI